jgi:hypothetical protein
MTRFVLSNENMLNNCFSFGSQLLIVSWISLALHITYLLINLISGVDYKIPVKAIIDVLRIIAHRR